MPDNLDNEQAENSITKEKLAVLRRLTATIAHDIRNPLGTIKTSVFSIKTAIEKDQPERIERAIRLAERNIKRCDSILAGFIDITQQVDIKKMQVNIDALVKGLIEEQTFPPSIECINDLNCDRALSVDPAQLRRALTNVLKNAIQAMRDNSVGRLTVQTSMAGECLIMCVSDTGTGIPEDIYPRIFEPLFSSKRFGVGLGLTVAREVVEKHGGAITVESKTGSGTKVTLKIPTAPL